MDLGDPDSVVLHTDVDPAILSHYANLRLPRVAMLYYIGQGFADNLQDVDLLIGAELKTIQAVFEPDLDIRAAPELLYRGYQDRFEARTIYLQAECCQQFPQLPVGTRNPFAHLVYHSGHLLFTRVFFQQHLDLARSVQQNLLPDGCPTCGDLDFAAVCDPAYQVGGDFYDIFTVEGDRVALLLGDVSGKGLPAALVMGLMHGAVRSSYWTGDGDGHEEASRRLNQLMYMRTSVERFASMFWCYYEPEQQKLSYVNAGHLAPFVATKNGDGLPNLHRLEEGGPVLGVIPVADYRQGTVDFQAGDLLVLYSDGVVEAANAEDEEFGEERMGAIIQANHSRSAAEIRDEILRQVRLFLGGEQLQDDLTLLVVRAGREVEPSSRAEERDRVPALT